jgi:hypothetical protein
MGRRGKLDYLREKHIRNTSRDHSDYVMIGRVIGAYEVTLFARQGPQKAGGL